MKDKLKEYKNWIIGIVIVAIIILLIIWYRNVQKNKAAELAKAKLLAQNQIIPASSSTDVGKTAFARVIGTKVFDKSLNLAYIKNVGEFIGSIQATQTDAGSNDFYKVANTTGQSFYVLKSQVTVK